MSFRPLSGKWGYRFMRDLVMDYQVRDGFRPLSGKWGYRSLVIDEDDAIVIDKFPSPLGEMGLSIFSVMQEAISEREFPSPLGEMGLSIGSGRLACTLTFAGIVSVPSRGNGVIDHRQRSLVTPIGTTCFRPLSGKWGYRYFLKRLRRQTLTQVSVPSRGNGVIDCRRAQRSLQPLTRFPSPLGEMGLSICKLGRERNRNARCNVSVPSRGNGVIDHLLGSW